MIKFLAIFFIITFSLTSCGRLSEKFGRSKTGETLVRFSPSNANVFAYPPYLGKFIVYAVGVNGTTYTTSKSFSLLSNASEVAFSLPNGFYKFYGITWEGPTNPLEGVSACGSAFNGQPVALNGGLLVVNLNLDPTLTPLNSCGFNSSGPFAPSGYSGFGGSSTFFTVNIDFCNGITGSSCTTQYVAWDSGHSMQVSLLDYVKNNGIFTIIPGTVAKGVCVSSIINGTTNTNMRIPPGTTNTVEPRFLAVSVDVFSNVTCSGSPIRSFIFQDGMINGIGNPAKTYLSVGSGILSYLIDVN